MDFEKIQLGESVTLYTGDCLTVLKTLPENSVHCVVTSPPYWGLRDYGTGTWEGGDEGCDHKHGRFEQGGLSNVQLSNSGSSGYQAKTICPKCGARRIDRQLGLEQTPEEYLEKMVEVFREVRRVLRNDGTLWLNMGDSYLSQQGKRFNGQVRMDETNCNNSVKRPAWLKPKDICGIPWRLALALQADGWWWRDLIIWAKPNPMPESVTDRCTKAFEPLFMLTKKPHYYYDAEAIKEGCQEWNSSQDFKAREDLTAPELDKGADRVLMRTRGYGTHHPNRNNNSRNKRSVWTIPTQAFSEVHFATFPEKLVEPCLLAGTSEKGCCPTCGAPWERVVEKGELKALTTTDSKRTRKPQTRGNLIRGPKNESRRDSDPIPRHYIPIKTLGWRPRCECNDGIFPRTHNRRQRWQQDQWYGRDLRMWEKYYQNESRPVCIVLDPFSGAGTTGVVAYKLNQKYIGIELNPEYQKLAAERIREIQRETELIDQCGTIEIET